MHKSSKKLLTCWESTLTLQVWSRNGNENWYPVQNKMASASNSELSDSLKLFDPSTLSTPRTCLIRNIICDHRHLKKKFQRGVGGTPHPPPPCHKKHKPKSGSHSRAVLIVRFRLWTGRPRFKSRQRHVLFSRWWTKLKPYCLLPHVVILLEWEHQFPRIWCPW